MARTRRDSPAPARQRALRPLLAGGNLPDEVNLLREMEAEKRQEGRPEAKRKVIAAYEHRMQTEVTHPIFGYKVSYRRVLEVQSRLLARVLAGELKEYPAFISRG